MMRQLVVIEDNLTLGNFKALKIVLMKKKIKAILSLEVVSSYRDLHAPIYDNARHIHR